MEPPVYSLLVWSTGDHLGLQVASDVGEGAVCVTEALTRGICCDLQGDSVRAELNGRIFSGV